jgi:transposase
VDSTPAAVNADSNRRIVKEVMHLRCAGLDVHKDTVVACARIAGAHSIEHRLRTFSTKTKALLGLLDWLAEQGCPHVAMEATGVYWKPVWHILDRRNRKAVGGCPPLLLP